MKFWQKIFFGTLVIFMIAFDAGALYLTSHSYNFNRQRETESAVREQTVILSSVSGRIANAETFYPDAPANQERLAAVMRPLAEFYRQQGVLLALFGEVEEMYSDIPIAIDKGILALPNTQSKNTMEATVGGSRHVLIASKLPDYPHLTLIYARNISQIDDFRADIGRVFIILNVSVLVFLGASIFLLLKRLTKPITELQAITAEIAGGAYEKRASADRGDELGALAGSFNRMADSVERQMAQLRKAADEKQQFVDDLTHELRTPLTSILGYAEYLQNAKSTEEERVVAASHLYLMATRLKNLSNKLMDLTFLRGERIEMRPVDVSELFDDLRVLALPLLIPRKVALETTPGARQVCGDETLLLSLLVNLVENASRASKEGGVVKVKAYGGDCPVIEVTDSGRGMEQEDVERITAPFYRVDKSRSREFGGVGLGLSIVSQIVALHGARMEIDSVAGIGTAIRIHMPAIPEVTPEAPAKDFCPRLPE